MHNILENSQIARIKHNDDNGRLLAFESVAVNRTS
ncbi:unnamed protein product, partial [Rotaria sordida]